MPAPGNVLFAAALLTTLMWTAVALAAAPGFIVEQADTTLVDGVHRLNARVALRFSPEAVEAMENGVAMTVSIESEVLEVSRLWDRTVAKVKARYRIQVNALSRQYLVRNLSTGETSGFRTLDEVTRTLGTIQDFPLLDDHVLDDDADYRVRIRANLETESLPTPLRLTAYFNSAWRLSSDWLTWPLQR